MSKRKNKNKEKKINIGLIVVISIICLAIIILIVFGVLVITGYKSTPLKEGNFIYLGQEYEEKVSGNYKYIMNEDELDNLFSDIKIKDLDFNSHNYILLQIPYDECSEENVNLTGYYFDGGKLVVNVEYEAKCGLCAPSNILYLLEVEKYASSYEVDFNYIAKNSPHCDPTVAYKPIIYLYPTVEQKVSVKLGNDKFLTTTYPKYNNNWNVVAYPNGTLKDEKTGREYYGLYWEGNQHSAYVHDTGFVVKGSDTQQFLEEKLEILGLNNREANEFIIYWSSLLENNAYNYIYFETMDEINNYMPLEVEPSPDSIIRVQMDYKPLIKPIKVKEEKIVTPERCGFSVVEWGGSIIKD